MQPHGLGIGFSEIQDLQEVQSMLAERVKGMD